MHVVCQWIGNSQPIAAKHYLQVTDEHFSRAVHLRVQQPAVLPRTGSQADRTAQEKTPVLQGSASECDVVRVAGVPRKDSNNLKKHRDVWPNPKQALQKALQLVTICRRSTPSWPR